MNRKKKYGWKKILAIVFVFLVMVIIVYLFLYGNQIPLSGYGTNSVALPPIPSGSVSGG